MKSVNRDATCRIGQTVRRFRQGRGMSLADVSLQLLAWEHSLSVDILSKKELGKSEVSASDIVALAAVFRVTPNDLLLPGGLDLTSVSDSALLGEVARRMRRAGEALAVLADAGLVEREARDGE